MNKFRNFWKGKKVFITGHTGFKGSWLLLTLNELGAKISGYSLPPVKNGIFKKLNLQKKIKHNNYKNILEFEELKKSIIKFKPDIIFHLAAQPLVLESYRDPYNNFKVNSLGTLNLLEIIRNLKYKGTAVIVTTDKVYKTGNKITNFKETDEIGVTDPYGSSKVVSEIIAQSYAKSFLNYKKNFSVTVARSGNVIGGGDYSKDRIIPDFYKSLINKKKLYVRNPEHIRPWQHVIEPIFGYILLAKKAYQENITKKKIIWNFGPNAKDSISVLKLINKLNKILDNKVKLSINKNKKKFKETKILILDSRKAKKYLNWQQKIDVGNTLENVNNWYQCNDKNKLQITINQIRNYISQYFV